MLLEDVGVPQEVRVPGQPSITKWDLDTVRLRMNFRLRPDAFPPRMYVVESAPGEVFFHRMVMGRDRIRAAKHLIRSMIWAVGDELRDLSGNFAQWVPLNGGLYFRAWKGMADLFDEHNILPLQTSFMEAGRREVSPGVWKAVVRDSHKGYFFAENIIIAEGAMASGSTGEAMVEFIAQKAQEEGGRMPARIILFVAAGSWQGVARTWESCKKHGMDLMVVLSQAIFHVTEEKGPSSGKTFTDLCLLHEQTIASERYAQVAEEVWQGKEGCVVGDVGQSFVETREYTLLTMNELFAPTMLGLDPARVDQGPSNIDVRAVLSECPFLLEPLPTEESEIRDQLRAVKRALIRHQRQIHWG